MHDHWKDTRVSCSEGSNFDVRATSDIQKKKKGSNIYGSGLSLRFCVAVKSVSSDDAVW